MAVILQIKQGTGHDRVLWKFVYDNYAVAFLSVIKKKGFLDTDKC
jgi:hypothetical protein